MSGVNRPLQNVSARRPDKAKRGEEAECTGVHEHSEPRFNAVWASADTFRTEPNQPDAFKLDGRMIDAPVLARADRIFSLVVLGFSPS
ncbi:hypothetical protein DMX06_11540 [Pseudomonas mosselii]|nr:hypothetical protein DMX06_11540 [Pseudomonas mosselii]